LLTREEYASAIIHDGYYQILPDLRSLNYGTYINEGVHKISEFNDLNSHNSRRLSKDELIKLFNKVPEIFTEK
jgi:UDP-glucose 4-epimerase